jgi:membrane peptidoglycan carboxypeptidase
MAKQKKKKGEAKKKSAIRHVKKDQKAKAENTAIEKPREEENRHLISFSEKIELEKSGHTYKTALHRKYGKYYKRVKKPAHIAAKVVILLVGAVFFGLAFLFMVFGRDLPDVSKLKTMNFSETTRIYDREGNVLYSIFDEENRKYVPLGYIAPLAVDATLSIEDKNFYNHIGFDPFGMIRAQVKNMQEDSISQGASTITQQLAKNIFLSPERTYERKVKELLLSLEIEWMYSKEEILEMYLNKISYGSNSYGIEAAAQTYFAKSAKDLNLIESAVLAALPKAPSYYSPYGQNKKELMGYCGPAKTEASSTIEIGNEPLLTEETIPDTEPVAAVDETATTVPLTIKATATVWAQVTTDGKKEQFTLKSGEGKDFSFKKDASISLGNDSADITINGKPWVKHGKYLSFKAEDFVGPETKADVPAQEPDASAVPANYQEQAVCDSPYDPDYVWGRKDYVLQRMVEDRYITKEKFEAAWKEGLTLKFRDPVHKIEAPHFVFYIKELLEQKYGKDLVESGGLEVKTSLDPKIQSLAEEAVKAHSGDNLARYGANNAALVAIDPKTGQILAMVGSVDYWNPEIDGQVNVAASPRQPGSSFKPLVYALAIQKKGIGSGTILSDLKTVFNKKDVPRNSDNEYKGKMTVRTALSNSRNIPAIKAYYLAGEEEEMLNFLDKIGLDSLRKFRDDFNKDAVTRGWTFYYGWPMAIGSGEVKLIDLASAYGVLANGGTYLPLDPILEVRDRKGNILEKHEAPQGEQVLDPQAAYIVSSILSDVYARPAGSWRASMTIDGHTVAAKTGTSNKKVGHGIYPNNNIMIGYTPSIVAAVWVGNTNGDRMRGNAWAFADCGPMWKDFLTAVLKDKPDEPFPVPEGIVRKGNEVYPSFADYKTNFDKPFVTMESEETQTVESDGSFISSGANVPDAIGTETTTETPDTSTDTPTEPSNETTDVSNDGVVVLPPATQTEETTEPVTTEPAVPVIPEPIW